jgi:carboxymethylenebutenolidase
VTRRAAQAGYLAVAPNALAPLGGTPANEDEARQLFTTLKAEESLQNFIKVFDYLPTRKDCNGKFGCVGFCWGGLMAGNLAVNVPSLRAAVAFYGRQPEVAEVPKIKSAVQLHYASLDERVNAGIGTFEEALKNAKVNYELFMYEGVNHAFHNDTSAARYNEAAAKLAWQRTLAFFEKHLG